MNGSRASMSVLFLTEPMPAAQCLEACNRRQHRQGMIADQPGRFREIIALWGER